MINFVVLNFDSFFIFLFSFKAVNANTTNRQLGNFEKLLLDTNKLNVHFAIAEFCY